jgi:[histone H3]-lysine36 N-trimethyltransferase
MAADERIPGAGGGVKTEEEGESANGAKVENCVGQNGIDMSRDDSQESSKSKDSDRSGAAPKAKSAATSPQKRAGRQVQRFDHLPDATEDAEKTFQVINDCLYGSKHLGSTSDHDVLDCECVEDWREFLLPSDAVTP